MPDNVRVLVVRLSFQHGDTRSQIAAIKNEVKLLDSGFKAAAAQAGGFSTGLDRAASEAATLQHQVDTQRQAVEKYAAALQQATKRHQEYGQRLEEAKAKQSALKEEIIQLKTTMEASKKATGDQTDEYIDMYIHLEELQSALKSSGEEIKSLESGYARADKAIASADKSIQSLSIAQNEAREAQGRMESKLATLNARIKSHADGR